MEGERAWGGEHGPACLAHYVAGKREASSFSCAVAGFGWRLGRWDVGEVGNVRMLPRIQKRDMREDL